nr:DUF1893 domain-containing protein [uncultured Ruminococcus sp.]
MTDIELAKAHLDGHSICLCRDGEYFTDDGRGISPMIRLIEEGRDLHGYAVADIIVGKAAAMLFIKAGIREVYGEVMSRAGYDCLQQHDIPCAYGKLTEKIINRKGDGICPMEQTVALIDDPEEGTIALQQRMMELRKGAEHV